MPSRRPLLLRDTLGPDPVEVWAYGDSAGDREMLEMADHPTRVTRRALAGRCGHRPDCRVTKTALITGITGQDGSYLAELLLDKGYQVIGLHRRSSTVTFERISHLTDRLTLVPADLLDEASMIRVLRDHRPAEVYNLAAQSFVQTSFAQPVLTGEVTALGVTRLLDAILLTDPTIRFYQASSSEMFGKVRRGAADRAHPLLPPQPVRGGQGVRPLDHRQLPGELRPARQVRDPVQPREPAPGPRVRDPEGDLQRRRHQAGPATQACRSATSTPSGTGASPADYVRAMWLMLQQDEPGDYVIATGETHLGAGAVPDRLRPGRARLGGPRGRRPAVLPARRGRPAHR